MAKENCIFCKQNYEAIIKASETQGIRVSVELGRLVIVVCNNDKEYRLEEEINYCPFCGDDVSVYGTGLPELPEADTKKYQAMCKMHNVGEDGRLVHMAATVDGVDMSVNVGLVLHRMSPENEYGMFLAVKVTNMLEDLPEATFVTEVSYCPKCGKKFEKEDIAKIKQLLRDLGEDIE